MLSLVGDPEPGRGGEGGGGEELRQWAPAFKTFSSSICFASETNSNQPLPFTSYALLYIYTARLPLHALSFLPYHLANVPLRLQQLRLPANPSTSCSLRCVFGKQQASIAQVDALFCFAKQFLFVQRTIKERHVVSVAEVGHGVAGGA